MCCQQQPLWEGGETTVPKGQVWEEWGWAAGSQGDGTPAALGAASTVMAPGQCRKTGLRGKLAEKDEMDDRSVWRRFVAILEQGSRVLIYWWHDQVSGRVCLQRGQAEYFAAEMISCFAGEFLPSPFLFWLPALGVLPKSWGFQPVSWPLQTEAMPVFLKTACALSSSSLWWIPASSLSSNAYSAFLARFSPALEHTEPWPEEWSR